MRGRGPIVIAALVFTGALGAVATAACSGGTGSWNADDTRKTMQIVNASHHELELCAPDGGPCAPSQVRALSDLTRCKAASMLYAHREPIPEDAGGDCPQ